MTTLPQDKHIKWIETCWSNNKWLRCVISDFHYGVNDVFTLLGCYAASKGS